MMRMPHEVSTPKSKLVDPWFSRIHASAMVKKMAMSLDAPKRLGVTERATATSLGMTKPLFAPFAILRAREEF